MRYLMGRETISMISIDSKSLLLRGFTSLKFNVPAQYEIRTLLQQPSHSSSDQPIDNRGRELA